MEQGEVGVQANKARVKKGEQSETVQPMEKNTESFLLFPDRDFHFKLGLGESGSLFNITQIIITDCTSASGLSFS